MESRFSFRSILAALIAIISLLVGGILYLVSDHGGTTVTGYKECVAAGYPIQQSYPRKCTTPDGHVFSEPIL